VSVNELIQRVTVFNTLISLSHELWTRAATTRYTTLDAMLGTMSATVE